MSEPDYDGPPWWDEGGIDAGDFNWLYFLPLYFSTQEGGSMTPLERFRAALSRVRNTVAAFVAANSGTTWKSEADIRAAIIEQMTQEAESFAVSMDALYPTEPAEETSAEPLPLVPLEAPQVAPVDPLPGVGDGDTS